jgi:heterodisulfide reductase subunit B
MKALYYPGCSQKATAKGYEESLLCIAPDLGLELVEMEDWNCCGTTTVMAVNKVLALSLAARNLALAEATGLDTLITPCPSCWLSLHKANEVLKQDGQVADKVRQALDAGGFKVKGTLKILHLLDVLIHDIGVAAIQARVTKPLKGLRVAPYYGCQVIRPYAQRDDAGNPNNLEALIGAVGGTVADFALRTACCGGTLVATREGVGNKMAADVLRSIHGAKADLVVTPCSLCQTTIEMVQRKSKKLLGEKISIPVITVTQLIGMGLGKDRKAIALQRSLAPRKTWRRIEERPTA